MKYNFIFLLYLNIFCLFQSENNNDSYINKKDFSIKDAIFMIRNREDNLNLIYKNDFSFIDKKTNLKPMFKIIRDKKRNNSSEVFYFIKEINFNSLLSAERKVDHLIIYSDEMDINNALWKITPKINEQNKLIYYIQNKKNKCYWELNHKNNITELKLKKILNKDKLNKNNEFVLIEFYKLVKNKHSNLLEKEPIDVLIKYIDLNDDSLNRTGITTIKKDYEHEEIKYSVRSILKNIPWIRKIFILMPNEKVKYFKPREEIKEKIIYIKDKNLLGFDSGNSCTFQYNLFKMRQYGLSENFILMDDDYFIAKPINKNEMFYEENGKIYPAIITSDYYEMNKDLIIQRIERLRTKKNSKNPHSPTGFYIRQKQAQLFLYDIFGNDNIRYGKKLIEPAFSHNAIPLRMSDLEEIYKYIYDYYEYGKLILYATERTIHDLQFQTLYWGYVKNKYDRKVSKISSEFYDISSYLKVIRNKAKLFVINSSTRNYNQFFYIREKSTLEKLFPEKTKYETDEIYVQKINENKSNKNTQRNDNNQILFSDFINTINEEIKTKSEKYEFELDTDIFLKKLKNYFTGQKDYKILLKKEIKYMKQQCQWQEIVNIIFVIFFLLLIFYRYLIRKGTNTENNS
jgi:hypothetical protein